MTLGVRYFKELTWHCVDTCMPATVRATFPLPITINIMFTFFHASSKSTTNSRTCSWSWLCYKMQVEDQFRNMSIKHNKQNGKDVALNIAIRLAINICHFIHLRHVGNYICYNNNNMKEYSLTWYRCHTDMTTSIRAAHMFTWTTLISRANVCT